MVAQDVQLFQATLRENLALFNRQVTDARLEQVLKELRLWDWASVPAPGPGYPPGWRGRGALSR